MRFQFASRRSRRTEEQHTPEQEPAEADGRTAAVQSGADDVLDAIDECLSCEADTADDETRAKKEFDAGFLDDTITGSDWADWVEEWRTRWAHTDYAQSVGRCVC